MMTSDVLISVSNGERSASMQMRFSSSVMLAVPLT